MGGEAHPSQQNKLRGRLESITVRRGVPSHWSGAVAMGNSPIGDPDRSTSKGLVGKGEKTKKKKEIRTTRNVS